MTLVGIVLTIKEKISCWPVAIVGILAYLVVFIRARLYADAALQPIYVVQNIYGWWYWARGGERGQGQAPIVVLSRRSRAAWLAGTAIVCGRRWRGARALDQRRRALRRCRSLDDQPRRQLAPGEKSSRELVALDRGQRRLRDPVLEKAPAALGRTLRGSAHSRDRRPHRMAALKRATTHAGVKTGVPEGEEILAVKP